MLYPRCPSSKPVSHLNSTYLAHRSYLLGRCYWEFIVYWKYTIFLTTLFQFQVLFTLFKIFLINFTTLNYIFVLDSFLLPRLLFQPKDPPYLYLSKGSYCDLTVIWFTECLEWTKQILPNVCYESSPMLGNRDIYMALSDLIMYNSYLTLDVCCSILIDFYTSFQSNGLNPDFF